MLKMATACITKHAEYWYNRRIWQVCRFTQFRVHMLYIHTYTYLKLYTQPAYTYRVHAVQKSNPLVIYANVLSAIR